jgi:hypothetical protein
MPSDRPTRPHGTFTPATTIGRTLTTAGFKPWVSRKDIAFGGHRCSWDKDLHLVRVGYRCGDEVLDKAEQEAERNEMLDQYEQLLTSMVYPVERSTATLYVDPKKEK